MLSKTIIFLGSIVDVLFAANVKGYCSTGCCSKHCFLPPFPCFLMGGFLYERGGRLTFAVGRQTTFLCKALPVMLSQVSGHTFLAWYSQKHNFHHILLLRLEVSCFPKVEELFFAGQGIRTQKYTEIHVRTVENVRIFRVARGKI